MSADRMRILREDIAYHLDCVRKLFLGNPKITIVVRNPDLPGDVDVVMTDDDLDAAVKAIRHLEMNAARVYPPDEPQCLNSK